MLDSKDTKNQISGQSAVPKNTRVVIAIDFGTSRSGYAFNFIGSKEIHHNVDWPDHHISYYKNLTELLYSPSKAPIQWGFSARQMLADFSPKEARQHSLLQTFKMDLQATRNVGGIATKRLPNGQIFEVQTVITDYLRFMKDFALTKIKMAFGSELRNEEILWCLTVPAIWKDHEKNVMRRAALGAGLIEQESSERLLLALEPEAAAVYCQENAQFELKPGHRFMIVDCGGGTVDITAHEVSPQNGLSEVVQGTGGAYGSTYVDQSFRRYLDLKLGAAVIEEFERTNTRGYLQLMDAWERTKCAFGPTSSQSATEWRQSWKRNFPIVTPLYNMLLRSHPEVLERLEEEQGDDENLTLNYATMDSIFAPVVKQIVGKVRQELTAMKSAGKKCDYLLLVGGFAESPLLQQTIKSEFSSSVGGIVIPAYPGAAIVQGAVSFALNPYKIRSRCSRLTYGWRSSIPFLDSEHPKTKRELMNDKYYCRDIFTTIVKAGQPIAVDDVVKKSATPIFPDQTAITFTFFATERTDPKYTDEPEVREIGVMTVEMPDTTGGTDRQVEVRAFFGRTEIQVEATDLTSGSAARTTLHFSSTFSS